MKLLTTAFLILTLSAGANAAMRQAPADSLSSTLNSNSQSPASEQAGIEQEEIELDEIKIVAFGPRRLLSRGSDGSITLTSSQLSDQPSFMGSNDPMSLLRTLPAIQTASELQPGIFVRGSSDSANLIEADGAPLGNPMHMLGLFSTFNPAFYDSFTLSADYIPALTGNCTAGHLSAQSSLTPDTTFNGLLSAGILESHAALSIPLRKGKSSISIAARQTYINLLFPNLLQLGESRLRYGFTDANASLILRPNPANTLRISLFFNRDAMTLLNPENSDGASKDGHFGWSNYAASLLWQSPGIEMTAGYSGFSNRFELAEAGREINLPSRWSKTYLRARNRKKALQLAADFEMTYASGQYNKALQRASEAPDSRSTTSLRIGLAAQLRKRLHPKFEIEAGLRLDGYHCSDFNRLLPLPSLRLALPLSGLIDIHASYALLARYERTVEESDNGLPANFRVNAARGIPLDIAHSFSLGAAGNLPVVNILYSLDLYYKIMPDIMEFRGNIFDLLTPGYNPAENLLFGRGYSMGLSISLMRQFGKLRGRIGYNLGKSRVRIPEIAAGYIPTSFDRPHDLNVTINWNPHPSLTLGANFVYATGTPYTRARYGYMIGENLICEYFPKNSSRLPDYRRLDISANWTFLRRGGVKHSLNLSVYNVLACHNVLFLYTSYDRDHGLRQRRSEMKSIIPSITYTCEF